MSDADILSNRLADFVRLKYKPVETNAEEGADSQSNNQVDPDSANCDESLNDTMNLIMTQRISFSPNQDSLEAEDNDDNELDEPEDDKLIVQINDDINKLMKIYAKKSKPYNLKQKIQTLIQTMSDSI